MIEKFLECVNGTKGAGSAVVGPVCEFNPDIEVIVFIDQNYLQSAQQISEVDPFTGNNLFLVTAPISGPFDTDNNFYRADSRDGTTHPPAPASGATFGLRVLWTPAAGVMDQSVNPVARMSDEDLLTTDLATELQQATGVTNVDTVEWLTGPDVLTHKAFLLLDNASPLLFGQQAELRSFTGVISGDPNGPFGVGIHMTRVEYEGEIVIAAGVQRTLTTVSGWLS